MTVGITRESETDHNRLLSPLLETHRRQQEWLGEDGRSNDEDAYVSEELASNEDTMAMCSKINYILEHTIA